MFGATVSAAIEIPRPSADQARKRVSASVRRATERAPTRDPALIAEYSSVKVPASPWNVRSASSGRVTWNSKAKVPMTVSRISGSRSSGVRQT